MPVERAAADRAAAGKCRPGAPDRSARRSSRPSGAAASATRRIGRRVSEASPTQLGLERPPGQEARQQADRGPRVAAVERAGRRAQAREPDAGDPRLGPVDPELDAQRLQRRRRRQVVAATAQAGDLDDAVASARRTAARGARSTCRRGRRSCRATGPSGGQQRGRRRHDCLTYHEIPARAPATICKIARSLSASPSRRSAGTRRWPCTRVPSAVSDGRLDDWAEAEHPEHRLLG